ncbi:MAG: hypothetical protein WCC80_19115, partial [Pseudolabrys sp.]
QAESASATDSPIKMRHNRIAEPPLHTSVCRDAVVHRSIRTEANLRHNYSAQVHSSRGLMRVVDGHRQLFKFVLSINGMCKSSGCQ